MKIWNDLTKKWYTPRGAILPKVLTPSVLQDITSYLEEVNKAGGFNPRGIVQGQDSGPTGKATSPPETL
jgi:hypothetical protein